MPNKLLLLKRATEHLTEASKLVQQAGVGEHSRIVQSIRDANGSLLLHLEVKRAQPQERDKRLAAALDAVFPEESTCC